MSQPPQNSSSDQSTTPTKGKQNLGTVDADFDPDNQYNDLYGSHIGTHPNTSLISPTKLRQQAKQSAQVVAVDTWLQELFAPDRVPVHLHKWKEEVNASIATASFDTAQRSSGQSRNVIQALQDLQQANLLADERNRLLHAARSEELGRIRNLEEEAAGNSSTDLLKLITANLTPAAKTAIDSLASGAVALGMTSISDENKIHLEGNTINMHEDETSLLDIFSTRIDERTLSLHDLQRTLLSLEHLQQELSIQLKSAQEQHQTQLTDPTTEPTDINRDISHSLGSDHLHAQTAQFTRDTKHLNLKLTEYRDRISQLDRALRSLGVPVPVPLDSHSAQPSHSGASSHIRSGSLHQQEAAQDTPTAESILSRKQRLTDHKRRVEALQDKLRAYNGLPADYEASRVEVARAVGELDRLKKRREELFALLGGS